MAFRDFFIILTVELAMEISPTLLSDFIALSSASSISSSASLLTIHGYSLEKISFGKSILELSRYNDIFLLPSCNA